MTSRRLLLTLALGASLLGARALAAGFEKTVALDGSGDFTSVQEAILAAPTGTKEEPAIIHVKNGTYVERLYLQREKRFLRIIGESAEKTVLAYHLHAKVLGEDGKAIGTFRTASTYVDADDFTAENLTFANTAGPVGQALAIRVDGDRAVFRKCRFLGWQDTILTNRGRQYFEDCYIEGHVDFIFGGATSYFMRCEIRCLRDGYVTAASTPKEQAYGYVFNQCKVSGAEASTKTYLGRPWRVYAGTVFMNCELSEVVRPVGWNDWNKAEAHQTARYAEFNNKGPGAELGKRADWVKQLSAAEAQNFSPEKVLAGSDGWTPVQNSFTH